MTWICKCVFITPLYLLLTNSHFCYYYPHSNYYVPPETLNLIK